MGRKIKNLGKLGDRGEYVRLKALEVLSLIYDGCSPTYATKSVTGFDWLDYRDILLENPEMVLAIKSYEARITDKSKRTLK